MLLGVVFLIFLIFSYIENKLFFNVIGESFQNQPLAIAIIFIHNVLVISLILVGMTFYVNLVVNFLKEEKTKYGKYIVLEHPKIFAAIFTLLIIFLSIFRECIIVYGTVALEVLPSILLISAPVGILEGYGIYLTIKKTLSRNITMKDLMFIYGIFLVAAILEVSFINFLIKILV